MVQTAQNTVQVPRGPFSDLVVDVPGAMQQGPVTRKVQRTVAIPQLQFIDKVVDASIAMPRHVPTIEGVQKTVDDSQVQHTDKLVDVPVRRRVPVILKVLKIIDEPVPPIVDETVPAVKLAPGRAFGDAETGPNDPQVTANCWGPTFRAH